MNIIAQQNQDMKKGQCLSWYRNIWNLPTQLFNEHLYLYMTTPPWEFDNLIPKKLSITRILEGD
jgi:hypothetical protein